MAAEPEETAMFPEYAYERRPPDAGAARLTPGETKLLREVVAFWSSPGRSTNGRTWKQQLQDKIKQVDPSLSVHANVDALVERLLPALLRDVHRVTVDPPEPGDMVDLDEGGGVLFTAPAPNRVEPVVGEIGPPSPEGQFETTRVTVRLARSRTLRRGMPQPPVFRAVQVREALLVPHQL